MDNQYEEDCAICGVALKDKYCHKLDCNHIFHYDCLMKTFLLYKNDKNKFCPYCRGNCGQQPLPMVNGLRKLHIGIHCVKINEINNYANEPCKTILKRGKRKGEECGKNCKLGYTTCVAHFKADNN